MDRAESQNPSETHARSATVAQLRDDIDRGRTGDKIGGLDPAAAPLGTDEEAAGTPVAPETIAGARAAEQSSRSSAKTNAAQPSLAPNAQWKLGGSALAAALIGGGAGLLTALALVLTR